ncbi:intraflagellar transport 46 [Rhynchophorus ferrugineus]|uniref:Intraflagellar transport protein 46 homolog n=1 Tax=Rhynchophorus ferrugineus TaxID=354439 RepID=A0A834M8E3_RHYFE|nr:hypothetical protein GWI33_018106 [Rhynchophorus ferrugineus]
MQRSFSIVDDDTLDGNKSFNKNEVETFENVSGSDSEDISINPSNLPQKISRKPDALPQATLKNSLNRDRNISNSSESDESENDGQNKVTGEYDPNQFENLEVDAEIKELFQYIQKYTPQHVNTEFKFKPFIPEFLPAVGDIDAFLKVIPPEKTLSGEIFDENILQLGLLVLDEPASNQSDPALLHLQLRAANDSIISPNEQKSIVVKKIDNLEKSGKVIDKWIKDISHLHKSKSSPIVHYSQPMPDLDTLMEQWPEDMEQKLKNDGFPKPSDSESIIDYVDTVCRYFSIPIAKNKIQSLHLLFCLYAAIKQSKSYQSQVTSDSVQNKQDNEGKIEMDQLVLD